MLAILYSLFMSFILCFFVRLPQMILQWMRAFRMWVSDKAVVEYGNILLQETSDGSVRKGHLMTITSCQSSQHIWLQSPIMHYYKLYNISMVIDHITAKCVTATSGEPVCIST